MITLDGTAQAAVNAISRGVAILVELDFTSGTSRYTTWSADIVSGSTYLGLGTLASVSNLSESEDRSAKKLSLDFTIVNQAMLALLIGPANVYRRKAARIYQQFMDDTYKPAGAKVLRWSGYMDNVAVDRTATSTLSDGSQSLGKISLHCSRAGVPMSRRQLGMRSTHQQQIARSAGDLGLEYQQALLEKPAL